MGYHVHKSSIMACRRHIREKYGLLGARISMRRRETERIDINEIALSLGFLYRRTDPCIVELYDRYVVTEETNLSFGKVLSPIYITMHA
jgi:hypothetical protein